MKLCVARCRQAAAQANAESYFDVLQSEKIISDALVNVVAFEEHIEQRHFCTN